MVDCRTGLSALGKTSKTLLFRFLRGERDLFVERQRIAEFRKEFKTSLRYWLTLSFFQDGVLFFEVVFLWSGKRSVLIVFQRVGCV